MGRVRAACVEGLGYPDVGDEALSILADMVSGVDLLVLVCPLSRPKPRLLELLVSELVELLEAPVAVVPCDCELVDPAEAALAVRRGGGHPLHEEPLLTDGVGVAAAVWVEGGCGVERSDALEDLYAGRLLRWVFGLRGSVGYVAVFSRRGGGLPLRAAMLASAAGLVDRVQAGCGGLDEPTVIELG